jgi:hypothetical protein
VTLVDRVESALADDGPLANAIEGFEPRPGQRRLAMEVARTFENGGTLIAEAGTGTGKTLAYLVPAVLSGRRVLISTGTRTLQDQVFYKDVPALARALGTPIRAAVHEGPHQLPVPAPFRPFAGSRSWPAAAGSCVDVSDRRVGRGDGDRRSQRNRRPA